MDRAAVEAFFGRLADAWKTNDGTQVAACFAEDASLVNPFGERADGRAAIGAMYGEYFRGMLRGTTTAVAVQSVRDLGTDHAFVDARQTVSAPDGSVVLAVHLASLLRREGDQWCLLDGRPYTYAELPR